jgi:hypothetical protein
MAINTYPAIASPVKSVQRGSAAGAGTVTITAIDITKSFVNVFGTASSGTVAATGALSADNGVLAAGSGNLDKGFTGGGGLWNNAGNQPLNLGARNYAGNIQNLSGGSNNLVAAVVQGYLSNSTSLVVSGACRWEVVEFN